MRLSTFIRLKHLHFPLFMRLQLASNKINRLSSIPAEAEVQMMIVMIKTGLRTSPTDYISRYETNAISGNRIMNRFLTAINKLYYRRASLKSKPAQKSLSIRSRGFARGFSRRFKNYCKQDSHDFMQGCSYMHSAQAPLLRLEFRACTYDIGILAASFHSSFAAIMLVSPLLLAPPDFRNGSKAIARIFSSVGAKLGSSQLCPGCNCTSEIPRIRYAREINLIQGPPVDDIYV